MITDRLIAYRARKLRNGTEPDRIMLNWKHLLALEKWVRSCGLKMADLKSVIGYRVMGMMIINKGK